MYIRNAKFSKMRTVLKMFITAVCVVFLTPVRGALSSNCNVNDTCSAT